MGASAMFAAATAMNVGSQLYGAYSDYQTSKLTAKQYALQSEEYELQKSILTDQYRQQRQKLQGDAVATAAANGLKVSGSVAESISNSLQQLGLEESYKKFSISMEQNNLAYQAKAEKINARSKLFASLLNAGSSAASGYSKYNQYWGS